MEPSAWCRFAVAHDGLQTFLAMEGAVPEQATGLCNLLVPKRVGVPESDAERVDAEASGKERSVIQAEESCGSNVSGGP